MTLLMGSERCPRLVTALLIALTLATPAAAGTFDARESVRNLRSASGWLDRDRVPLDLPLLAPHFATPLRWDFAAAVPMPAPRATLLGWVPSILLLGAFATTQFALQPPHDSRWTDRNGFDSGIRRGLRGGSSSSRDDASLASDVLFGGMGAALLGDWWWLREEHGLLRSVQIDTRWFLATNIVTRVAKISAARQRPYVQPCSRDGNWVSACGGGDSAREGFFSGHASNTAMLAGLLCARHLGRREVGAVDAVVCGGAAAGALTTGILRIVSDRHFATDVIAGWAVGGIFGYLLPSQLDYRGHPRAAEALRSFAPVVGREYYGFQYGGRF